MPNCASGPCGSERSRRPAPKNHRAIPNDRSAERALVEGRQLVGTFRAARLFERRLVVPGRVAQVHAEGTREAVAPALGDQVDHAAGEPPVLGGDAGGEDLRFLDGVLDEDVVGGAEEVVVHVDAVDHEDVVVGEAPRDRDLTDIRACYRSDPGDLRDSALAYGRSAGRLTQRLQIGRPPSASIARLLRSAVTGTVSVTSRVLSWRPRGRAAKRHDRPLSADGGHSQRVRIESRTVPGGRPGIL